MSDQRPAAEGPGAAMDEWVIEPEYGQAHMYRASDGMSIATVFDQEGEPLTGVERAHLFRAAPLLRAALMDWLSAHTEGMQSREAAERVYASGRISQAVAASLEALTAARPSADDDAEPGS